MNKKNKTLALILSVAVVLIVIIVVAVVLAQKSPTPDTPSPPPAIKCPMTNRSVDADSCASRGCVWNSATKECRVEGDAFFYGVTGAAETTPLGTKTTLKATKLLSDAEDPWMSPTVEIERWTDRILRVKIGSAADDPFEVRPLLPSFMTPPSKAPENPALEASVETTETGAAFARVVRRGVAGVEEVFKTAPGSLVLSRRFLGVTNVAEMGTRAVYGLGEHYHQTLRRWPGETWGIFARDNPIGPGSKNLYGAHPFYVALEKRGDSTKAHGVLLLNSNAMDVSINADYSITWQTIGGVLDFYIIDGPSMHEVVDEYYSLIGRPMMPPYWTLGFQLCRWGYRNDSEIRTVFDRVKDLDIPFETQYADIDYMDRKMSFTIDDENFAGLPDLTEYVHNVDRKFMVIIDPAIAFDNATTGDDYEAKNLGLSRDLFIKDARTGRPLEGKVWPGKTVYPDFTDVDNAVDYYAELNDQFYLSKSVKFDGLWIDMNEPSNFEAGSTTGCADNRLNHPKWIPDITYDDFIYEKTICMDAKQKWGRHYDVHSLYGFSQALVTYKAYQKMETFKNKRPFVLTRSTFPGSGHYSIHWLGDNSSGWDQLKQSIVALFEFGLFGIPMNGADICGFFGDATEELCSRWSQLGAFYPFARNHNAEKQRAQDPGAFGHAHAEIVKDAMRTRYTLLPLLYTLLYRAHVGGGGAVARALVYNFPEEVGVWDNKEQFMWGESLLISPVLSEGQIKVNAYFPGDQPWYNWHTGFLVKLDSTKRSVLDAPIDQINLHIRGGHIVPFQGFATTINAARRRPFGLVVALPSSTSSSSSAASGELFWDDGESDIDDKNNANKSAILKFTATRGRLKIQVASGAVEALQTAPLLANVRIYDSEFAAPVKRVTLDGKNHEYFNFFDDEKRKMLFVTLVKVTLTGEHEIRW